MPHTMFHPDQVLIGQKVRFFTDQASLAQVLGGSNGPHDATVLRLHGGNVADLEVETGLPFRITVAEVPCGTEGQRWEWIVE